MARAAKMMDVVVAGRMAKMRVRVSGPVTETTLTKTLRTVGEAMRLAGDAELSSRPRSDYRNALIN